MDILKKAEELLTKEVPSIVDFPAPMSKGGIHDYYSEGIYWHPDKRTASGYPYVRKDGVVNRNSFSSHRKLLEALKKNSSILYRAYRETGDRRFSAKLEEIFSRFFIDESSRMNPNMKYAEAVPGLFEGRSIGIMDSLKLLDIPEMVKSLNDEGVLSDETREGVAAWFDSYTSWLNTLEMGECGDGSGYSTSYYLQLSVFSGIAR